MGKTEPKQGWLWISRFRVSAVMLALVLMAVGGTESGSSSGPSTSEPVVASSTTLETDDGLEGFDSHTLPELATTETYFGLAREGVRNRSSAKFLIPDLDF